MLEAAGRGNCEDCFEKSRSTLVNLARQYTAGDHWLRNPEHSMPGGYSLLAIHAMSRRIDTQRSPFDLRGPFLREDSLIEADENILLLVKSILAERAVHPDGIEELREIAKRRRRSYDGFLNRGREHWESQGRKVLPFFNRLTHPDRADPPDKRERLEHAYKRAYWLDQGAFILAKTALGKCTGPWFRMCLYGEKYQRFHVPLQQIRI